MTTAQQPQPQQPAEHTLTVQTASNRRAAEDRDGTLHRAKGAHTIHRRLADADPPPPEVNHPLYAVEATAALGSVAYLADAAPWWFAAAGGLTAVTGSGVAWIRMGDRVNTVHPDLVKAAEADRRTVTRYTALTSLASGGVLYAMADAAPWSATGAGALGLATVVLAPFYGVLRRRLDRRNTAEQAARAEEIATRQRDEWESILEKAGAKDVWVDSRVHGDVGGIEWEHGRRKFPAGFALALRIGEDGPEPSSVIHMTPNIEKIAVARLGLPIRPGAVQIHPRGMANELEMIVPTRDILNEDIDVELPDGPRSVNDPIPTAYAVDGTPLELTVIDNPHAMFSGQNNSGKSNFLDTHALEFTRCTDNVTWMICGSKPVRNFAGWMLPFLQGETRPDTGQPVEPVLDWIAGDLQEATMMLLDLYAAIDRRQQKAAVDGSDKWIPTPDDPRITCFIDESLDFLQNNQIVAPTTHRPEDKDLTFSDLLLKVLRLARSEAISVYFLVQRGTGTMFEDAGNLKSQVVYRVGFRDSGHNDTNAVFTTDTHGIDGTMLPQGALYSEMAGYTRPVLAKAPRVTAEDKRQAAIRHSVYAGPIDSYTASALNYYRGRWTRQGQQEFLRQICPDAARTVPGQAERHATSPAPASGETSHDSEPAGTDATADVDELATEVDALEALFNAPAADRPDPDDGEPEPGPDAGPGWDPDLPADTRDLLSLIAEHDVLYAEWVTSNELLRLAADELDWPTGPTGHKRIAAALREVNVEKPSARPERGGKRLPSGYWGEHVRAALAAQRPH